MSNYRRATAPGGCFFFTVVTHNRRPLFADTAAVDRLRNAFRRVMSKRPFTIDAVVVLPDHLHCIWQLPQNDTNYSTRWRLIKSFVSSGMDTPVNTRGEAPVWQRRFWEHLIRNESDWRRHMDYIHYNPVKHGYARQPKDWPHSSFKQAVGKGWYEENWGTIDPSNIKEMNVE